MQNSEEWFIGTSGFQFEDWIGTVYPQTIKKSDVFDFYCNHYHFNSVELNSTFYVIPGFSSMEKLLSKAPEGFKFAVKLHRSVTHERRLDELNKFLAVAGLFSEQNKLLCFLAQFPYSFKKTNENIEFLSKLKERFSNPEILFLEMRHDSWNSFAEQQSDFNFTLVDLPPLPHLPQFADWVQILRARKQKTLYARFHGRNRNWYGADEKTRYNYLYSNEELQGFAIEIKSLKSMHNRLFFNNCYMGNAMRNALDFRLFFTDQ
ncbi:MAG: DUF72 domain-containing protein [Caldisericaceae bacterium]